MVRVSLEALPGDAAEVSDLYVSLRVGAVQKLSKIWKGTKEFKFSDATAKDLRFGKVEVFRRIGSCSLALYQPAEAIVQTMVLGDLSLKAQVGDAIADSSPSRPKEGDPPRKAAARAYFQEHMLEIKLADAFQAVLKERPEDPAQFLAQRITGESVTATPAQTRPVSRQAQDLTADPTGNISQTIPQAAVDGAAVVAEPETPAAAPQGPAPAAGVAPAPPPEPAPTTQQCHADQQSLPLTASPSLTELAQQVEEASDAELKSALDAVGPIQREKLAACLAADSDVNNATAKRAEVDMNVANAESERAAETDAGAASLASLAEQAAEVSPDQLAMVLGAVAAVERERLRMCLAEFAVPNTSDPTQAVTAEANQASPHQSSSKPDQAAEAGAGEPTAAAIPSGG